MKAYANARGYLNLPIGYYTTMLTSTNWLKLGEYLACGNSSDAIDFLGLDLYTWCGSSSTAGSGYDDYLSQSKALGIPTFLSEDGCSSTSPRYFSDQAAVFGSEESTYWSGAIIYGWREEYAAFFLMNPYSGTRADIAAQSIGPWTGTGIVSKCDGDFIGRHPDTAA